LGGALRHRLFFVRKRAREEGAAMAQYKTVLQEAQDDFVEKRSRFIG